MRDIIVRTKESVLMRGWWFAAVINTHTGEFIVGAFGGDPESAEASALHKWNNKIQALPEETM